MYMFGDVLRIGMSMDVEEKEVGIKPPMGPKAGVQSPKKKVYW
jgi:IMP dehydrogenase/GMP reductase